MSSVMAARTSGEFHTNRNPAESESQVIGSGVFLTAGLRRIAAIIRQTTTPQAASRR